MTKLTIEIINESTLSFDDIKENLYKGERVSTKRSRHKARYDYQSAEGSKCINLRLYYRPPQIDIPDAVVYVYVDTGMGWRIGCVGNDLIDIELDRSKLIPSACITLTLKNKN